MSHSSTVLSQLLKLVPRHEFQSLAKQHHVGQRLRTTSRWDQFVALFMAQLSGRQSLRDIESNQQTQRQSLYHCGAQPLARTSLARLNERQPHTLFEALFNRLLKRCQSHRGAHGFRFKSPLYSLDASLIDLSLQVFPWAKLNKTKAAVKLHVGLNHGGMLPEFVALTDGLVPDLREAKAFAFPRGSIVVCDKGYVDYGWYQALSAAGVYFVTRQKTRAVYRVILNQVIIPGHGVTSDQLIELNGKNQKGVEPQRLRRVSYHDTETNKDYVFLTNRFDLAAQTIAAIYKARWQIELFFKAIKQNLKIHAFIGNSRNAVLTQVWIALCAWLLLWFVKAISKTGWSLQGLMRVLQMNVFTKRDLLELARGTPPPELSSRAQLGWWG